MNKINNNNNNNNNNKNFTKNCSNTEIFQRLSKTAKLTLGLP